MAPRRAAALALTLLAGARCAAAAGCPGNTTADEVLAKEDFSGRVAVVTGGDSGIGFAVAKALARRGATVIIGNRNLTTGELAAQNISQATGAEVHALPLDLSSLASVRAFAVAVLWQFGPGLHLLVNNAGIADPSKLTADGFELVFEVDYLGHFLLTELLLPALRAGATQGGPARIVNVASGAHENACEMAGWPADCFKDWTYLPPPVVPFRPVMVNTSAGPVPMNSSSYGIAKFLNIQHAAALAKREGAAGIEAFSMTPGFCLTSMTGTVDPSFYKAVCDTQIHPDPSLPANPCPFSAEQGAAAAAFCVSGQAPRNGAYYSRTWACEERAPVMQGFTEAMQLELYERSLGWAGLAGREQDVAIV